MKDNLLALSHYNRQVLVGNWFEVRFADDIDKKAIAPAITGKSICESHKSSYQTAFTDPKTPETYEEIVKEFNEKQLDAASNAFAGFESHITFADGEQYFKNFTTTTDIAYRIVPQSLRKCGNSLEFSPKPDYDAVYGNATVTGLNAWKKCPQEKEHRWDLSVTKSDFVP